MSNFLVGTNLADVQLDKFNGDTSTVAFTLSVPSSTFSALVRISGVVQTPTDDFSIVNSTLTFTTAPPSGSNNIVVTYTKAAQLGVPNDASVSSSKLASNAVTTAKILDANITTAKILDANITTSKLQDNAVSLAKLSGGTANKFLGYNGSGDPVELDEPGGGKVLQMVQTVKTTHNFFSTNGTWLDATGVSQAITPSATTSKILVAVSFSWSGYSNAYAMAKLVFDDNGGGYGDMSGSMPYSPGLSLGHIGLSVTVAANEQYKIKPAFFQFLHSPSSTNVLTYKLQTYHQSDDITIGKPQVYSAATHSFAMPTIISCTEISA